MQQTLRAVLAQRLSSSIILLLTSLLCFGVHASVAQPVSGSIVISQVYGGGGATSGTPTYRNDYIELFNRSATAVSLQGWSLQYGSATGNFGASASNIVSLTGTIQPGQYYLVQVGTTGTVGAVLPRTPDQVSSSINMAVGNGKVALVTVTTGLGCGTTTAPCALPSTQIVDLVSYGVSNNGEGGATVNNGTALTNQQGGVRRNNGCQDTDNNNSDFEVVTGPVPRNSTSPTNLCASVSPTLTAAPNPLSLSYTAGSGPVSRTFTVAGSNLNPAAGNITIASSNTAIGVSTDGTTFNNSVVLPYSGSALVSTTLTAQLVAGLNAGLYSATLTISGGGASVTVPVTGTVANPITTITPISTIQGSGLISPLVGQTVAIEGVVTRAFAGTAGQNGFYVQSEDNNTDGNPLTSEGIFCFDPAGLFSGAQGTKVRVTGTVAEFATNFDGVNSSLTQLGTLTSVSVIATSQPLPAATVVTLPVPAATGGVPFLERYEGMLITATAATGNLTVTEHFNLGRFGQVTLAATDATNQPGTDARIDQYTQFNAPSVSGYATYTAAAALRDIILDDASSVQNPPVIIFGRGGNPLSASNTLRGGDDVASITTVLDERFDGYRLQTNARVNFNAANPRPTTVPDVGGSLKIAGANVLNYFVTFGGTNDRGADNQTEFDRQRAKVIANLVGTGGDVLALSEIQNNGYGANSAVQDLVNGLNAATSPGTYTFINAGNTGSDAIMVAMVYKPASVSPVGAAAVIPNAYGNGAFDVVGRKPIAQTFRHTVTGGVLTVVVNHWKSKGSSSGGAGDTDAGDGQSLSNGTRVRQAQDLLQWLGTRPTGTTDPDYLILGDLNSYALEDPMTTLKNGGYNALLPTSSYSFAFQGQWGSLDHALSTGSLTGQVTGASKWYINSDEPRVLDYNTEFKTPSQVASLYAPDQFRSADHDPLVVGFALTPALTATLVASTSAVCTGSPANLSVLVSGLGTGDTYSYAISNGTNSTAASGVSASAVQANLIPTVAGSYTLTVLTSAGANASAVSGNVALNVLPAAPMLTSAGRSLTVSATPVNLTQFITATESNTLTFTGANGLINPPTVPISQTGVQSFSVTQTSANGCVSPATVFNLTVVAVPVVVAPGSQTVCRSSRVVLNAGITGTTYQWFRGGTSPANRLIDVAGVQQGTRTGSLTLVSAQTNATYWCVVTTGSATQTEGPFTVVVNFGCIAPGARVAAEETPGLSTVVAPNPLINGQLRATVTGVAGQQLRVQVIGPRGQVLHQQNWQQATGTEHVECDLNSQPSGLYLLQVQTDQQQQTVKVIKP